MTALTEAQMLAAHDRRRDAALVAVRSLDPDAARVVLEAIAGSWDGLDSLEWALTLEQKTRPARGR